MMNKNIFKATLIIGLFCLNPDSKAIPSARAAYESFLDRGIQIFYTRVDLKEGEEFPKEIMIGNVNYPLFKTKEEAIAHVKSMSIRKDITIVYVASSETKDSEMVTIEK